MLNQSIPTWIIPGSDWVYAPNAADDALYQAAVAWAREFTPEVEKEAYAAALDHAHRKYALTVEHFDAIDRKTDELLKTTVTLTALLVGAVKALEMQETWWFTAPFLCFMASIVLAVIARRPTLPETPGPVREVLEFVEDFRISDRFQIDGLLAASYHCAVVGTQPLIQWKAQQLLRATALFVLGVLLLPLAL